MNDTDKKRYFLDFMQFTFMQQDWPNTSISILVDRWLEHEKEIQELEKTEI
jgi:hypothetical protein